MKEKYNIDFQKAEQPIIEPITKFGGQPVWIEKPEWAVSRATGKPMTFICQIALDQKLFGDIESKMAYIFMTDADVDGTWEPDGGENAVIIQPNGNNPASAAIETGPTIYEMRQVEDEYFLQPFPCEFAVNLSLSEDSEDSDIKEESADDAATANKIGGEPGFLQSDEYPTENKEDWQLLLQLDSCSVPFDINFGDSGIGYAFLSRDGKTGKFLWQCC